MSDEQTAEEPKSKYTNRGGHGGPVGNQKGLKHGYYALSRLIKRRGALDKRSMLGKMVQETTRQLEADLGGDLSTAQRMLIEDVAVDTLLIQGLNARLGVAAVHKGRINPIYTLRSQLISQRREHLKLLGLKRVSKEISLSDYLSEKYGEQDSKKSKSSVHIDKTAPETPGSSRVEEKDLDA
jgi:hypothetical protein